MTPLSKRDQDRLVSQHYEYAKKQARLFHKKLPWLEYDDLVQEAAIAMMKDATVFDPDRGVSFITFCTPKLQWRMLDYARRQSRSNPKYEDQGAQTIQMWAAALSGDADLAEGSIDGECEEVLTQKDLDTRLARFPYVQRRLMGHTITDMGAAEKVAPSTIFRRMQKEIEELKAEVAEDRPSSSRKSRGA